MFALRATFDEKRSAGSAETTACEVWRLVAVDVAFDVAFDVAVDVALQRIALRCIAVHDTTLHYTTLHYTTLHYTTLHYTPHHTAPHHTTPHHTPHTTHHTPHTTHHTPTHTHCTPHTAHRTPHTAHRTPHCTLHTAHCTLYTIHYTLYTIHCALYTIHYTLYTIHCTFYTFTLLHFFHFSLFTIHYTKLFTTLLTTPHYTLLHNTTQHNTAQHSTAQHNTAQHRQDKTRQDKTRQDKTRQDKTRQDKTRQDKTRQNKNKNYSSIVCVSVVSRVNTVDESSGRPMAARGAAWRRRQRRLRSMLRHERQTVAMALAESQHHSAQRQRTARARGWIRDDVHGHVPEAPTPSEPGTRYFSLDDNDSVLELGGSRPDRLSGVRPQERVPRRIVEQIVDSAPVLPLLHDPDPMPQMVDSVEEVRCFFHKRWPVAAEQTWDCEDELVFEVPMILQHTASSRSSLPEPQTAEQLVAVPGFEFVIFRRSEGALGLAVARAAGQTWAMPVHDTGWQPPPAQGGL